MSWCWVPWLEMGRTDTTIRWSLEDEMERWKEMLLPAGETPNSPLSCPKAGALTRWCPWFLPTLNLINWLPVKHWGRGASAPPHALPPVVSSGAPRLSLRYSGRHTWALAPQPHSCCPCCGGTHPWEPEHVCASLYWHYYRQRLHSRFQDQGQPSFQPPKHLGRYLYQHQSAIPTMTVTTLGQASS